jgi:cytochrome c peroxidase
MVKQPLLAMGVLVCTGVVAGMLTVAGRPAAAHENEFDLLAFENASGQARTVNLNGALDLENPFFQDLGANGRRCVTCHQPENAWTITPANVRARFSASRGTDPIFRNNDGSNCEGATPGSRAEQRAAYSLVLTRGLIRVGLDVPPGAEFALDSVDDPNYCGPASNEVSVYRRPLPTTNLRFLSGVMWDGRESSATTSILQDLLHQANSATRGHAQAAQDITGEQAQQIVELQLGLFTAQARDNRAESLHAKGARGGPRALSQQEFFIGVNDPVGLNPTGAAFDPRAFTVFDEWSALAGARHDPVVAARRAIARGQELFNTKSFTISGVSGLNGQTFPNGVTVPASITGTCTICHDTPNAGDHSVKAPLNIGLTDPAVAPYLPVYTLRNLSTQDTVRTTDPGRAMITGKWQDVGRFKGPILRALAARAPYFHNGSAETLEEAIEFYNTRFNISLTTREQADLAAFLRAL